MRALSEPDFGDSRVFFPGDVSRWSPARLARLLTGRSIEPDISALLGALVGRPGECVIDFMMAAAGLGARDEGYDYHLLDGYWIVENRRVDAHTARLTRREPDFLVTRIPYGGDRHELVVAVEVKGRGAVNYIRCPADIPEHRGYSNQLICYAASCWLADDAVGRDTLRYVWLGPGADMAPGVFPRRALTGDVRHDAIWALNDVDAIAGWCAQEASIPLWHLASLEDLAVELSAVDASVGAILLDWIERL